MFRIPTIPDIVEDMGRPLNYGLHDCDTELEDDLRDTVGAEAAGASFIQGSSTGGGVIGRTQAEGEIASTVRCLPREGISCELTRDSKWWAARHRYCVI